MKRKAIYVAGLAAMAISATAVFAESQWVKTDSVNILGGKGAVYPVLGVVKKGTELTVYSHEGKWLQVQPVSGGPQGWVFETSLSPQKVSGDMISLKAGDTAEMGTGAAARGLQPTAETYVKGGHLNKAPLEQLIALRKSIPPEECDGVYDAGKGWAGEALNGSKRGA